MAEQNRNRAAITEEAVKESMDTKRTIDLNADLGEGFGAYSFGADEALLAIISSANIACGFHAGDPRTMRETVSRCMAGGVAIGAHPGLPDRLGFGRRDMAITPEEAYDYMIYQIGALAGFVRAQGGRLHHVKPHGALYHQANRDIGIAEALVRAVQQIDPRLAVYAQAGSLLQYTAEAAGLSAVGEAFADRRYAQDGTLMPRSERHALIETETEAAAQAIQLARDGQVTTVDGWLVAVQAGTLCVHGDGQHAVRTAEAIRLACQRSGIEIAAPVMN